MQKTIIKTVLRYTEDPVNHKTEVGRFVALDSASGGYPYAVDVEGAHDFKTEANAMKYRGHFLGMTICQLKVTYEIDE